MADFATTIGRTGYEAEAAARFTQHSNSVFAATVEEAKEQALSIFESWGGNLVPEEGSVDVYEIFHAENGVETDTLIGWQIDAMGASVVEHY